MDDVDRLASIAQQLVARVRDDDPEANARWLNSVATAADKDALNYVLAAAVPDDRTWSELVAWTGAASRRVVRNLRPHGSAAALRRHQYYGERACQACKAYDAERKRIQRNAALSSRGAGQPESTEDVQDVA